MHSVMWKLKPYDLNPPSELPVLYLPPLLNSQILQLLVTTCFLCFLTASSDYYRDNSNFMRTMNGESFYLISNCFNEKLNPF